MIHLNHRQVLRSQDPQLIEKGTIKGIEEWDICKMRIMDSRKTQGFLINYFVSISTHVFIPFPFPVLVICYHNIIYYIIIICFDSLLIHLLLYTVIIFKTKKSNPLKKYSNINNDTLILIKNYYEDVNTIIIITQRILSELSITPILLQSPSGTLPQTLEKLSNCRTKN